MKKLAPVFMIFSALNFSLFGYGLLIGNDMFMLVGSTVAVGALTIGTFLLDERAIKFIHWFFLITCMGLAIIDWFLGLNWLTIAMLVLVAIWNFIRLKQCQKRAT